jgi:regulatory protein
LSKRDYFKEELKNKLLSKGYGEAEVNEVINYLEKNGYINDEELFKRYREKYLEKGYSPLKLKSKLVSKGYSGFNNQEFSFEEELQSALNRLSKYKKEKDFYSVVKYLVNRGFSYSVAKEAANIFLNEAR